MRKFLCFVLALGLSMSAHAGIITYDSISSDAGVSYSHFNSEFNKVFNEINGNIGSVNILDDSLTEADFADSINPRVRDHELIGDYTYTGMLGVTDSSLTSDISAGTSYVNGYRIVTAATSKTYTASKDTYVYIDQNGAFQYVEVANGAVTPTTPSNSLLLFKAVTDGTAITSVTDLRTTTPVNLRIYQDLKSGLVISRDPATATKVTISRGEIELGTTTGKVRRNIVDGVVDFSSNGRNALDTGSLAADTFYYIYALADDGNAANIDFIGSALSTDAATVTGERLIGWCYSQSASVISPDSVGAYKGRGGDAPNIVKRQNKDNITIDDTAYGNDFNDSIMKMCTSGRPVSILGTVTIVNPATDPGVVSITVNVDNVSVDTCETTAYVYATGGVKFSTIPVACVAYPSSGTHTIKLQGKVAASSVVIDSYTVQAIEH